jgi:hypothetical protein
VRTIHVAALCATLIGVAPAARAQVVVWEADACADARVTATLEHCRLIMSGGELLRGSPATVVAVAEPVRPIALSRFVRGDAARAFAQTYERELRTGLVMKLIGGGAVFFESIAILSGATKTETPEGKTNLRVAGVMGSGLVVMLGSVPFRFLARRSADKAVDAHNRTLAKE